MTQKQFWYIALLCNVAFLFLYIFKQNAIMTTRHAMQQQEQKIADLQQRKKETYNKLQKLQQHTSVKKRAAELGMRKADLKQITPLTYEVPQEQASPLQSPGQKL